MNSCLSLESSGSSGGRCSSAWYSAMSACRMRQVSLASSGTFHALNALRNSNSSVWKFSVRAGGMSSKASALDVKALQIFSNCAMSGSVESDSFCSSVPIDSKTCVGRYAIMNPARKTRTLTCSGESADDGEPWRCAQRRWMR